MAEWISPQFAAHGFPNRVDAALARVTPDPHHLPIVPDIHLIDAPQGVAGRIQRGVVVHKTGRTTAYTLGLVIDVDFKFQID